MSTSRFTQWRLGARAIGVVLVLIGCSGDPGAAGPAGPRGADGTNGTKGTDGVDGTNGANGTDGTNGVDGANGTSCWDLNANGACDAATEDTNGDNACDALDCGGMPGAGYLPLEPAGVVGFVRDSVGDPVIGATVYLVPNIDIPSGKIEQVDINAARTSVEDEPLEDTIAVKGAGYASAVTDENGIYRIPAVAAGSYFVVAVPGAGDPDHLPGGSRCRVAMMDTDLVGKQRDIKMSTKPTADAEYVGSSVCLTCHGVTHVKQTLHALGIRLAGKTGPLQKSDRFPDWNKAITTKFTLAGTTIYYYAYDAVKKDWKVSETNPGAGVSFKARMYSDAGGSYWVELTNVATPADPVVTYPAEISYGGGLYKQRYSTKIGSSWYILPIQYNQQGSALEATAPSTRWVWQQYNAGNWYDEATKKLIQPAKSKAFDNNCAGCHFTGYSVTGDAVAGWQAHGVPDLAGEYDFDGDGMTEMMNVGCESCHGPGSEHWERAGQGYAIVSPSLLTPEREVTICAKCHTRALGNGGGITEAPLDVSGRMPVAGVSRKEFLTNNVSKMDDGLWDAVTGDGLHSKKHHQQASDFLKSGKYRNTSRLLTCTNCHDPHGKAGVEHQLREPLDVAAAGPGMCLGCHDATFPVGATVADRMQAHYAGKGLANIAMGAGLKCVDCHMPKTAKSGSGTAGNTIQGVTYWQGDISSHVFDVPVKADIPSKSAEMMPIAYTASCALCHTNAP